MSRITTVKLVVIFLINGIICENTPKKFQATDQWQVVDPGQPLPAGLHIRHDFESHITEAKLLDETEPSQNNDNSMVHVKLEKESDYLTGDTEHYYKHVDKIKTKFKTYEQLKDEFKTMNMSVKTDAQVVNDLFDRFKHLNDQTEFDNKDELVTILRELEYLMHHIDNGLELVRIDGMRNVILPSLKHTDEQVQIEALKVLSACCQHNPKVQIHAYEMDMAVYLVDTFTKGSLRVKNSVLTAVGSSIRRFPAAIWDFLEHHDGLGVLKQAVGTEENVGNARFRARVISILLDIFGEVNGGNRDNFYVLQAENRMQSRFQPDGWCHVIVDTFLETIDMSNTDVIFNTFQLVNATSEVCKEDFTQDNKLKTHAKRVIADLEKLAEAEAQESSERTESDGGVDDYYRNLKRDVEQVVERLYGGGRVRDEL